MGIIETLRLNDMLQSQADQSRGAEDSVQFIWCNSSLLTTPTHLGTNGRLHRCTMLPNAC